MSSPLLKTFWRRFCAVRSEIAAFENRFRYLDSTVRV